MSLENKKPLRTNQQGLSIYFIGAVLIVPSRTVKDSYDSTLPNSGHCTKNIFCCSTRRPKKKAVSIWNKQTRFAQLTLCNHRQLDLRMSSRRLAIRSVFLRLVRLIILTRLMGCKRVLLPKENRGLHAPT